MEPAVPNQRLEPPATKGKGRGKTAPFELCELCRLNHDQGRRHRYQASQRRALSALLSRFQSKLANLRHPNPLQPEHRLWCVFCGIDLRVDSPFACSKAITHLANPEHLKSLKDFLWKHGGGMDQLDTFRISEADFLKWEKSCKSLENEVLLPSEESPGQLVGPTKDIQNECTSSIADNLQKHSISSLNSCVSNVVMPLQSPTYRDYQVCRPDIRESASVASPLYIATCSSKSMQWNTSLPYIHPGASVAENLTGSQAKRLNNNDEGIVNSSLSNGLGQKTGYGADSTRVSQNLTHISSSAESGSGNVHTAALPPWLEASQENVMIYVNKRLEKSNQVSSLGQTRKLRKLNPKRVGAAWAEKRRAELEMEKRGEIVASRYDDNWLPNFGRVWQEGTRKESGKEFEKEKRNSHKDKNQPGKSIKMQPYISKRVRGHLWRGERDDDARDSSKKRHRSQSRSRSPRRKRNDADRDRDRHRDGDRSHETDGERGREREKSGSRERDDHDRERTRDKDKDRRRKGK